MQCNSATCKLILVRHDEFDFDVFELTQVDDGLGQLLQVVVRCPGGYLQVGPSVLGAAWTGNKGAGVRGNVDWDFQDRRYCPIIVLIFADRNRPIHFNTRIASSLSIRGYLTPKRLARQSFHAIKLPDQQLDTLVVRLQPRAHIAHARGRSSCPWRAAGPY